MKLIDVLIQYKIFERGDEAVFNIVTEGVEVDGKVITNPEEDIDLTKEEHVKIRVNKAQEYTLK